MSLFPILQPIVIEEAKEPALPLATEPAWDFYKDLPIFEGGEPKKVTGREAVKVWAFNALLTERRKWPSLSRNYGNDAQTLIGTSFSEDLKKAEATRYLRECLLSSPYITSVAVNDICFDSNTISMDVAFNSIYGEVNLSV